MRRRAALFAVQLAVALFFSGVARADDEAAALEHFRIGLDLVDRHAWDSALAELERSVALHPTRAALKDAALCLRELGRFDEAFDAYTELVARFGSDAAVAGDMARVEAHTATLTIAAPAGAAVTIDGRARDASRPVRVNEGDHVVRASAEGYAPWEARVRVDAGATRAVEVKLEPVARVGSVRVREQSGRVFEVVVDGSVVGRTPWSGVLTVGPHAFALRSDREDGARAETRDVVLGENAPIELRATRLPGTLRVEPSPSSARVYVDGVLAANGTFDGTLASGEHAVDIRAAWREPFRTTTLVSSRRAVTIRPSLERIRRVYVEVFGGPAFGAETQIRGIDGCDAGSCVGKLAGARLALQVTPRFAVGLFAGVLDLSRQASAPLTANVGFRNATFDRYEQTVDFNAVLFPALTVEYQFFDRTPLLLRLTTGLMNESVTLRAGGATGNETYSPSVPVSSNGFAAWVEPEVRIGYRVTRAVTFDVGVGVLFFPVRALGSANTFALPELPFPHTESGVACVVPINFATRVFF